MSPPHSSIVRLNRDRDGAAVQTLDQWAFAYDDQGLDAEPALRSLEWERTFGMPSGPEPAGDGPQPLSAMYSVRSLTMGVPGGQLPLAGLTWVAVHPGRRRRGLLTAMIGHHLREVRAAGREALSGLFASEAGIYGRFGYGTATRELTLTLPRGTGLRGRPDPDVELSFELLEPDRHAPVFSGLHTQYLAGRPGWVNRSVAVMRDVVMADPPSFRAGAERRRVLLARRPGRPVGGAALFRRRERSEGGVPEGQVEVRDLVAVDPGLTRALWAALTDLDLTSTTGSGLRPEDDPLLQLLTDVRAARPHLGDGLWLRIVDLPAALAGRAYLTELDVVLRVEDALLPENAGLWRLRVEDGRGTVEPALTAPDLSLDVRELGSMLLGGTSAQALLAAGLVSEHTPGAAHRVGAAFDWPVRPACCLPF